jgi:hypothetical protein
VSRLFGGPNVRAQSVKPNLPFSAHSLNIASAVSTDRLPGNIGRAGLGYQSSQQLGSGVGVNEVTTSMDSFRDHERRPATAVFRIHIDARPIAERSSLLVPARRRHAGGAPYLLATLTLAPSFKHNLTAASPLLSVERVIPGACPVPAATIRGVVPSVVVREGSAPCATNSRITSRSFAQVASGNGLAPAKLQRISELHMYDFTLIPKLKLFPIRALTFAPWAMSCHSPLFRPRQTLTLRYVHCGGVALQVGRFEQSARHRRPAGETGIVCPVRGESSTRGNN